MTILDLGNIRLNWRGVYDDTATYVRDDAVSYRGSSFIAKRHSTGVFPTIGEDWDMLAAGTDQLTNQGDLLTHDGETPIRLPRGEYGHVLHLIDHQPAWRPQGLPPSQRVKHVAQVNQLGGWATRVYLMSDGTLKACGYGLDCSNGDPRAQHLYVPSRVTTADPDIRFASVTSGGLQHYGLTEKGEVWSWGRNDHGQLGHGDTRSRATAEKIEYFSKQSLFIKKIIPGRCNYYERGLAYFLTTDGRVYACGHNSSGNIGHGTAGDALSPVRCGSLTNIVDVFVSGSPFSVYAIDDSGQLWVWGNNSHGQLGLGDTDNRDVPLPHPFINEAHSATISCGYSTDGGSPAGFGIVLRRDGTLWSTGCNEHGQLGLGDATERTHFTEIPYTATFTQIHSGDGSGMANCAAVTDENEIVFWGNNSWGMYGLGHCDPVSSPTKPDTPFQGRIDKVRIGGGVTREGCFVQSGNRLWAAGFSEIGNLGTGSMTQINHTFAPVIGLSGTIAEWETYGSYLHWGLSVLYTEGRVDACGQYSESGEAGTQSGNIHDLPVLKNVLF